MKLTLAAAIILMPVAFQASASCLNSNARTRLRTFCVAETLIDKAVILDDALLLDELLKLEGISAGIGLPHIRNFSASLLRSSNEIYEICKKQNC